MIYFLVNNGYQYYDVLSHVQSGMKARLIVIPHSIQDIDERYFDKVYQFTSPWRQRNWVWVLPVANARRKIENELNLQADDVLVLYTEYEPLNQYITLHFKALGATVFMIEDGGIASYTQNVVTHSEKLSVKERAFQFWTQRVLGYRGFRLFRIGGIVYPRMDDALIDAIVYYRPVPIRRNINRILATRIVRKIELDRNVAIFLNQPLYERYLNENDYFSALVKSICSLNAFSTLYFKFHPREKNHWKKKIRTEVINLRSDVLFVDDREPVESCVEKYAAGFAVSFFSSALLALQEMGVQPIYLYRMCNIDGLGSLPRLNDILEGLNYHFPVDERDISPAYVSGMKVVYSTTSVSEVLKWADVSDAQEVSQKNLGQTTMTETRDGATR